MKTKILIIVSFILILTSCTATPVNDGSPGQNISIEWHLTRVTGGPESINQEFDLELIIWKFDPSTGIITVDNTNTNDTIEDGVDSGTYEYSIVTDNNKDYIIFGDIGEYGNIVYQSDDIFTINQNNIVGGEITDGFIYTFDRITKVSDL